jgi:hypothetical protein
VRCLQWPFIVVGSAPSVLPEYRVFAVRELGVPGREKWRRA